VTHDRDHDHVNTDHNHAQHGPASSDQDALVATRYWDMLQQRAEATTKTRASKRAASPSKDSDELDEPLLTSPASTGDHTSQRAVRHTAHATESESSATDTSTECATKTHAKQSNTSTSNSFLARSSSKRPRVWITVADEMDTSTPQAASNLPVPGERDVDTEPVVATDVIDAPNVYNARLRARSMVRLPSMVLVGSHASQHIID
jgi:hypothetical protein